MHWKARRSIVTAAFVAFCALIAWLGGYDFNKRDFVVAYISFCVGMFALFIYAAPMWKDDDK